MKNSTRKIRVWFADLHTHKHLHTNTNEIFNEKGTVTHRERESKRQIEIEKEREREISKMNERLFFIIFIQSAFHALFISYLILYSLSVCRLLLASYSVQSISRSAVIYSLTLNVQWDVDVSGYAVCFRCSMFAACILYTHRDVIWQNLHASVSLNSTQFNSTEATFAHMFSICPVLECCVCVYITLTPGP